MSDFPNLRPHTLRVTSGQRWAGNICIMLGFPVWIGGLVGVTLGIAKMVQEGNVLLHESPRFWAMLVLIGGLLVALVACGMFLLGSLLSARIQGEWYARFDRWMVGIVVRDLALTLSLGCLLGGVFGGLSSLRVGTAGIALLIGLFLFVFVVVINNWLNSLDRRIREEGEALEVLGKGGQDGGDGGDG